MKTKQILYWITTSLIALETFAGGFTDLMHGRTNIFNGPYVADVVTSLGYPVYVLMILGVHLRIRLRDLYLLCPLLSGFPRTD
jgi:hypothetical protein